MRTGRPRVNIRLDKIVMCMTFISATLGLLDQVRRTSESVKVHQEKKRRKKEGFGFARHAPTIPRAKKY